MKVEAICKAHGVRGGVGIMEVVFAKPMRDRQVPSGGRAEPGFGRTFLSLFLFWMVMMSHVVDLPPQGLLPDGLKAGGWWHTTDDGERILCDLCPRACKLKPGDRGFCFVRENRDGQMVLSTYGRSTGFCIDPIEKKPLNHFYPGTSVLSFGTAGCNLGCKFCQNWSISKSRETELLSETASPEAIAQAALQMGCKSVAFTYNDPVVWAEYAIDTAQACRAAGVKTVAVTAGYITPQARGPFYKFMDAANVDLKAFTEDFYYKVTLSHLQPVLDTLVWLKRETNVWFEITNLIIPQANDSPDELRQMCDWILQHVGDEVPVHFSAFHPDFRMQDRGRTPPETLIAAHDIARQTGLKYAYTGNIHDPLRQSTYCPHCNQLVIERDWYELGRYALDGDRCQQCGGRVAGYFESRPGDWGRKRLPIRIAQFATPLPIVELNRQAADQSNQESSAQGATMSTTATPDSQTAGLEPLPLTVQQEQAIHRAAGELITAAIMNRPPRATEESLLGVAHAKVMGVFASLKRKGRLRSCCGMFGQPVPLAAALAHACQQTALRDARLPTISPTELKHLDLQVWLLFGEHAVTEQGADRIRAVTVGQHGLKIIRGEAGGLLLPGVAVDAGLSAEQFLEHVCVKAGLPTDAWKADDVKLITFEGRAIDGHIEAAWAEPHVDDPAVPLPDDQLPVYARWCQENIQLLARGATASFYLPGAWDGNVIGANLQLRAPGHRDVHLFQMSLRPGMPLQASLFKLCESAARTLQAMAQAAGGLGPVQMGLSIFHDPAMHGVAADPDLGGLDPRRRAMLAMEHGKTVVVYDAGASPESLMARTLHEIQMRSPEHTALYSLRIQATDRQLVISSLPVAQQGPQIRPAALAGAFYPGNAAELAAMVDDLLAGPAVDPKPWPAIMAPHAGLRYSGRLAAEVLRRTQIPDTVIVIGPKHTRLGVDWAVAPHDAWALPGGQVASDPQLARELVAAIPGLQLDAAAHQQEHAIEVELPLIARLAPQAKVVGIAIGAGDLERCRHFAMGLASVLRQRKDRVLLVISSDMNHFATDRENRRLDELALQAMETSDPARLLEVVRSNQISMCGVLPAVIVMETLRQLGTLGEIKRVGYATSADVSGDTSRVVGYAAMTFSETLGS